MSGWGWIRTKRFTPYDAVRVALGVLLLTTVALKTHQLVTDPVPGVGLLNDRWLLIGVVEFEIFLGVWLLAGVFREVGWVVAIACFGLFGCVSVYEAISGYKSCGCFGRVSVNPWYTAGLDSAIVAALALFRPPLATDFLGARVRTIGVWCLPVFGYALAMGVVLAGVMMLRHGSIGGAIASFQGYALEVDSYVKPLGKVPAGTRAVGVFSARNLREEPVTIIGAKTTCGCRVESEMPLTIGVGQVARLELGVEPGEWRIGQTYREAALFYLDVPSAPIVLNVVANVVEPANATKD